MCTIYRGFRSNKHNPLVVLTCIPRSPLVVSGKGQGGGKRLPTARPIGREHPLLRRLRKCSKNTLQLQTTVLADEGMRLLSRIVVAVLGPVELAHGMQVKTCKSVGASAEWDQDQAAGEVLRPGGFSWTRSC